jgi:hypothetical protein
VLDLVRTCNWMTLAQNRNLTGRYQTLHRLSTTFFKVPSAGAAGENVAVGSNILTLFQGIPARTGVDFSFLYWSNSPDQRNHALGEKSQNWLSVADDDGSALMFAALGLL